MFPFSKTYKPADDGTLVQQALAGSEEALSQLVHRHQRFIYNVALKFIRDADDAHDLTQEVLIKLISKLATYEQKSSFRTWLYRMTFNQFVDCRRKKSEYEVYSFDELGDFVEHVHQQEDMSLDEQAAYSAQIRAVRNRCMTSTLLCLDRPQRLVLILGSIFGIKSTVAAGLLDMTPEAFRQQLSRAKADLFSFMEAKCGLMNAANACRCHKKAKGFMKEGLLDTRTGQFLPEVTESIAELADRKNEELDYLMEQKYLALFRDQPYEKIKKDRDLAASLLSDPLVRSLFQLN